MTPARLPALGCAPFIATAAASPRFTRGFIHDNDTRAYIAG